MYIMVLCAHDTFFKYNPHLMPYLDYVMFTVCLVLQMGMSLKSVQTAASLATSDGRSLGNAPGVLFTEVATYKGSMVAVRRVQLSAVTFTRDDLVEMKAVSKP